MTAARHRSIRTFPLIAVMAMMACATADGTDATPQAGTNKPIIKGAESPQTAAESAAYAEFRKRVQAYSELVKGLQQKVPALPKEASPEQIDRHQRALAALVQQQRASAKPGDVFTPEGTKAIRAVLGRVFGGPDGKALKASIMDENPGPVKISVNGRYPDEVPLSTVPPQVLASLPKLPEHIEYRFVGDNLILLDVPSHIVVDFIDRALP